MTADDKVVIGQTHGDADPEAVLIGYLLGVESLRAGKEALMWLTKDGVRIATHGYVDGSSVAGAPSISGFRPGGARPPTEVIVAFIGEHRDQFGVEPICRSLQVAPSTYYAAPRPARSPPRPERPGTRS